MGFLTLELGDTYLKIYQVSMIGRLLLVCCVLTILPEYREKRGEPVFDLQRE